MLRTYSKLKKNLGRLYRWLRKCEIHKDC